MTGHPDTTSGDIKAWGLTYPQERYHWNRITDLHLHRSRDQLAASERRGKFVRRSLVVTGVLAAIGAAQLGYVLVVGVVDRC